MSWRVVRCVLDHNAAGAKRTDRLVLLELASFAHDDGAGAWPAQTTLASRTGYDRRTIQRSLVWLEAHKAIEVEQRPGRTHRLRVILCDACANGRSASQSRTRTNQPATQSPGGAAQSPGGATESRTTLDTESHEPVKEPVTEPPPHPLGGDQSKHDDPSGQTGGGGKISGEEQAAQNGDDAPPCGMCTAPLKKWLYRREGVHDYCVAKLLDRDEYKLLSEAELDGALDLADRWLASLGAVELKNEGVWILPAWLVAIIADDPVCSGVLEQEPGEDGRWFFDGVPDRLWAKHRHLKHRPEGA